MVDLQRAPTNDVAPAPPPAAEGAPLLLGGGPAPQLSGPEKALLLLVSLDEDVATRAFRVSEILGRPAAPEPPPAANPEPVPAAGDGDPRGRTLADLYFAQGHYAEALRIYDELVSANPFDEELRRLRRDAEARLLPAGTSTVTASADPAFEKRLKKIRALRQWLSVLQAG